MGHELDATAVTVIGPLVPEIGISGFTIPGVDTYFQDSVKGVIIVAAVLADPYRRRKRA